MGTISTGLTAILEPDLVGFHNSAQIDGMGLGKRSRHLEMSDLQQVRRSASGDMVLDVLAPEAIAGELAGRLSLEDSGEADSLFAAARDQVACIWNSISTVPADLFGFCGQLQSFETLGIKGGRLMLDEAAVRELFPSIDQGLLCPDRRALRQFGGVGNQGERLSDGVLFHVFGGADAEITAQARSRLLEICRGLDREVPDIVNGGIPTLQSSKACRQC